MSNLVDPHGTRSGASAVYGTVDPAVSVETAKRKRREKEAGNSSVGVGIVLPGPRAAVSMRKDKDVSASRGESTDPLGGDPRPEPHPTFWNQWEQMAGNADGGPDPTYDGGAFAGYSRRPATRKNSRPPPTLTEAVTSTVPS